MNKILYRPIIAISLVLGLAAAFELLALGSITWRNLQRIDKVKQDIEQGQSLEQLIYDLLQQQMAKDPGAGEAFHSKLAKFFANPDSQAIGTGELLAKVETLFDNVEHGRQQDMPQLLALSRNILDLQRLEEEKLLTQVYFDSKLELNFAVLSPFVLVAVVVLFGFRYFRRQVLAPLDALEQLLSRLINGEMQPIDDERQEPLMQPIFNSYNRLIERLAELEEEHRLYTQTLEQEIRNATHALLEQSNSLAHAERLAVVGEMAASAAHELRNPLAGIQAALENMRSECQDADMEGRLQMVSAETKRLTQRLNGLLEHSRHQPETAKPVDVARLVNELLTLLKYQVGENIQLAYTVPSELVASLPETEFRQALLNLLLNSVQAVANAGGTVRLSVQCGERQMLVEVWDSGEGFPAVLLEQGIRPFVSQREHGTGLGLSMVQRFARSLGGQLLLSNDPGGHACAVMRIPLPN